jgi:hypothetical protein
MLTEKMAEVILGAISCTYSEGMSDANLTPIELEENECALIKLLYSMFPKIVMQYSWLPHVKELTCS